MNIDGLVAVSPEENERLIQEQILNDDDQSERDEGDKNSLPDKQMNFHLRVFEMNLIFVGRKSAKKWKLNIVQIDKNEAVNGLKTGQFSVRDRANARSGLWKAYQEVYNENGHLTNMIRCRHCRQVDKYESEKGVKMLGIHAK